MALEYAVADMFIVHNLIVMHIFVVMSIVQIVVSVMLVPLLVVLFFGMTGGSHLFIPSCTESRESLGPIMPCISTVFGSVAPWDILNIDSG